MNFIDFINLDGNTFSVRADAILAIQPNGANCVIHLSGGQMFGLRGTREANLRILLNFQ